MLNARHFRRWTLLAAIVPIVVATAIGDEPTKFEVHDWSVWVGEPQAPSINSVADYTSAMPGIVETERSRRREASKPGPTPMSLITLYGEPPEFVDVDLRVSSGRPVAQWPRSEGKSNRLRWLDLIVTKEPSDPDKLVQVPEDHWFQQARNLGGLYVQTRKSSRLERFFTYDLELQTTLPMRLDGGPEKFKLANLGKHPLHDVLLIVPTEEGRRIGWLDSVPAAPTASATPNTPPETVVDVPLSDVLKLDSDEYRQRTAAELRKRVVAAGLSEAETDLLLSLQSSYFFDSDDIQVLFRFSPQALDELAPLTVEPETAKVKRVALLVARRVDPRLREDVDKLIQELGAAAFTTREQAEEKLRVLGRLAVPKLKEALKNTDLEVVLRGAAAARPEGTTAGGDATVDGDESPRSGGECGVRSFSPHLTQEPRTWLR